MNGTACPTASYERQALRTNAMIKIDENANGEASPELQGALQDALSTVLADPALAALARGNAPIAAAAGSPAQVIYANPAALALFGVADCSGLTDLFFSSGEAPAGQLSRLAETLAPGAAPRLERVRLPVGPGSILLLCRRTAGDHPLFVFSGLGRRGGFSHAMPVVPPVAEVVPESQASHARFRLRRDRCRRGRVRRSGPRRSRRRRGSC